WYSFFSAMVLLFLWTCRLHPASSLFPYTTLFRSWWIASFFRLFSVCFNHSCRRFAAQTRPFLLAPTRRPHHSDYPGQTGRQAASSEEHTSELQSRENLVCRLLLEKKNNQLHKYIY